MRFACARAPLLLVPAAGVVLLALAAGCAGTGGEARRAPTATFRPTEPPPPTLPAGERRRWGYDPWQATGGDDPPLAWRELPDGYRVERVLDGLDRPTHLAAVPDGRLLIAEQGGTVRVLRDGRLEDEPYIELDVFVPELDAVVELGLTGIAVDPDFELNGYLFLYYHTDADGPRRTVIARVRDTDGRAGPIEELRSWEETPPCCHIGGGMVVTAAGEIFVGVGDHEQPLAAQDVETPPGSILRIDRDGRPLEDNPFGGPVYAHGLRNPYDVVIDEARRRVLAGENGIFGQDALIEVEAGANYGWPGFSLTVPDEEVPEPLVFYHEAAGMAGMEFYTADALPALHGHLLFCRFHTGAVHDIEFAPDGSVARETLLARDCRSDIGTGPDGLVYFLDYVDGALHRFARD